MHTKHIGEFIVHHNGDFSGKVSICDNHGKEIAELPFWLLAHIVATKVKQDRIAAIEDEGYEDLLGITRQSGPVYD